MAGSRVRLGGYAFTAFGLAALMPGQRHGLADFALSSAGIAMAAIVLSLAGDGVEELGSARRIRVGLGLRLTAAVVAFGAAASRLAAGFDGRAGDFGVVLVVLGLVGVGAFAYRDGRVLDDLRFGQATSLRRIGERALEIDAAGASVTIALDEIVGTALAPTAGGRGLLIMVEADARIDGPATRLTWVEERLRQRSFFLDEHQLGGDALDVARRIARAKAREPGGYR
jgi:hypothetical protein